jgi:SET domain-containing protein
MSEITLEDTIDNLKFAYISKSKVHGQGLFSSQAIAKGEVLGYLDGQIIDWELNNKYHLTLEWNSLENNKLLVRPYRTKYSYINHSRTPNLKLFQAPLRVVSIKNISKNEELFLDYREEPLPEEYIEKKGKYYL